uniref:Enhancer of polycomb-like protein 1 n=1 Tax=Molossus molossus TaxID=27622 RepID=A0A7J8JSP2_MOLMO|nr:enhancer of polycomb-like protein 1 [Molossus molossus]
MPTDLGRSHPIQPPIMEESTTFHLPKILKMFQAPYAAWRLFLGTQVSSLYCYNCFSRPGFFFAYTNVIKRYL